MKIVLTVILHICPIISFLEYFSVQCNACAQCGISSVPASICHMLKQLNVLSCFLAQRLILAANLALWCNL